MQQKYKYCALFAVTNYSAKGTNCAGYRLDLHTAPFIH